ncbi:hypothetical protein OSTOST_11341, partial [Ostertagia ostertagi]
MSSTNGCNRNFENVDCGDEVRDKRGIALQRRHEEQNRDMDSPLGHLDPSRITHMVVDRVGLAGSVVHPNNDRFLVPGPPQQQWPRSSPAASPSIMSPPSKVMDGCGQMQPRMGTPTNMHVQQGTIGSPSVCSAPMTPQQQQQQQGIMQGQPTPTEHFDPSGGFSSQQQQIPHGYPQGIAGSSGAVQIQQQMMVGGTGGQGDSQGMYARQQQMMVQQQQQQMISQQQAQQQQMMSQQQPMMGQQMMVPQQMGIYDGWQSSAILSATRSTSAVDAAATTVLLGDNSTMQMLEHENFDAGITEMIDPCGFGIFSKIGIDHMIATSALGIMDSMGEFYDVPKLPSIVP